MKSDFSKLSQENELHKEQIKKLKYEESEQIAGIKREYESTIDKMKQQIRLMHEQRPMNDAQKGSI